MVEGPPKGPGTQVQAFIFHTTVSGIGIGQFLKGIIPPEQVFGLRPFVDHKAGQGHGKQLGHGPGQLGFAASGLSSDQQGTTHGQSRQNSHGLFPVKMMDGCFGPAFTGVQIHNLPGLLYFPFSEGFKCNFTSHYPILSSFSNFE
jgi:hypothetical protein